MICVDRASVLEGLPEVCDTALVACAFASSITIRDWYCSR